MTNRATDNHTEQIFTRSKNDRRYLRSITPFLQRRKRESRVRHRLSSTHGKKSHNKCLNEDR